MPMNSHAARPVSSVSLKQAYLDGYVPMAGVQLPGLIPRSIPVPRIRPQPSAVRDEVDHVIVQLGHRLIERGKPGTAGPGELGQVSVGYLAMADDPRSEERRVGKEC